MTSLRSVVLSQPWETNRVNIMLARSLGSVFASPASPLNVVVVDVLVIPGGIEGCNLAFF